jgi:hypothetical protein
LAEIKSQSGRLFDPKLVEMFLGEQFQSGLSCLQQALASPVREPFSNPTAAVSLQDLAVPAERC